YYAVSKGRIALALAGGKAIEGWEPDPVLVQFLDSEIKLTPLDSLHVHISKRAPILSSAGNWGRSWYITQLGSELDGDGTNLNVLILDKPPGFESDPRLLQAYLRNQLPKASNPQSGTIHGMSFTRVRTEQEERNYKGFAYFGVVDDHIVIL